MSRRLVPLGLFTALLLCTSSGPAPRIWEARASAAGAQAAAPSAPTAMDSVRVGVLRNGSYEVTTIPLETYVARVLAGEAAPETPAAALEALAIAIRTYTITNRGRHAADGFDLCDQTHCQVMRTATPATERAALATADQILLYRGTPATVFYSASCGGRSEKPSNVWPGADDPPYLPIHDDDACGGFPAWSAELADVDLQRALAAGGYKGMLRDVRILSRNDSGRVARLALDGMTPREITGQDLRMVVGRTLGFQHIQSTQFDLRRTGRAYRFTGRGAGHGVGLCVIGSMKLASAGQSATTILARYFPGTQLGSYRARVTSAPSQTLNAPPAVPPRPNAPSSSQLSAATGPAAAGDARAALRPEIPTTTANPSAAGAPLPTDVAVTLPQDDTAERGVLALLVARERQALATALGVDPPAVRVHVYESNEAYERGSGRPWFTLGAFVNDEIQLVPLWLLRERGMLDRTLRRELVHVMVDRVLPARPAWIRDGAAIYFADPESVVNVRPPCPQDNELQRPVSPGELGDALARARACFERQVGNGRDWRRVR